MGTINKSSTTIFLILLLTSSAISVFGQQVGTCVQSRGYEYLDVNQVSAFIPNRGLLFYRAPNWIGYTVPKELEVRSLWASSVWVGGMVEDEIRVAASRYGRSEFWAGPLDDKGDAPTFCSTYDRLFKVNRKDIELIGESAIIPADILDWPTGLGAPTVDTSGNMIDMSDLTFESRIQRRIDLAAGERPFIPGDQAIWWVMNDKGNVHESTGAPPLGIEVQGMAFAINDPQNPHIDNATFYKFKIINKSQKTIRDAYFSYWVSGNLGDEDDDYVGSDTLLNMGFVYNSTNFDSEYDRAGYGVPPAIGVVILEGPKADPDGIDNDKDGLIDEDGEMHLMSSFIAHHDGSGPATEPINARMYYNYMKGLWGDGLPFTEGLDGRDGLGAETKFAYPGDPVTRSYWSEINADGLGNENPDGYPYFAVSSGPTTLDPGEEEIFAFALSFAQGTDFLDSITELRTAAKIVREKYQEISSTEIPSAILTDDITLISPADKVTNQPNGLTLKWTSPTPSAMYEVEIKNWAEIEILTSPVNSILLRNLEPQESYRWRIRRYSSDSKGPWSEERSFTTGTGTVADRTFGVSTILTVANGSGPLDPYDLGTAGNAESGFPKIRCPRRQSRTCSAPTPSYQQITNRSTWTLHAGQAADRYGPLFNDYSLLGRITRQGNNIESIGRFDYELRFTNRGSIAASGSFLGFTTRTLVPVPFELWNIGISTPDDPNDDYRMIPVICDRACGYAGTNDYREFNLGDRHNLSRGVMEIATDAIFWYNPIDKSYGESGYASFVADSLVGEEVFAETILIRHGFPNLENGPPLPESGTIFRLVSGSSETASVSSPTLGSTNPPGPIWLDWTGARFDFYTIQIATKPNFEESLITVDRVTPAFLIHINEFGRYYWRVKNASGEWSNTWMFSVSDPAPKDDLEKPFLVIGEPFPNPTKRFAKLPIEVYDSAIVQVDVFDILGRQLLSSVKGPTHFTPGYHEIEINAGNIANGVYFYTVKSEGFSTSGKFVVLR